MDSEQNFPFVDRFPFVAKRQGALAVPPEEPSALPDGVYWQSGDATAKPPNTGQGWTSTLSLQDIGVGDLTTRETASGDTISVLDIRSAFSISSWTGKARWKGALIRQEFYEWNGTSWTFLPSLSPAELPHVAYSDGNILGNFSGTSSVKQHLLVLTEEDTSGGNMSVSDQRPS